MFARRGRALAAIGASAALAASLVVAVPLSAQAAASTGFPGPVQGTFTGSLSNLPNAATTSRGQHKLWYAGGFWWAAMPNEGSTGTSIHRLDGRETGSPTWTDTNVVIDTRNGTSSDSIYNATAGKLFIASHVMVERNTAPNPAGVDNNDAILTRYSLVDGAWVKDEGWPIVVLANRALLSLSIAQMTDGKIMAVFTKDAGPYAANTVTSANGVNPPVFTLPFKVQWSKNLLVVPDLKGATTLTGEDAAVVTAADGFVTIVFSNQSPGFEGYYVARHRVGDVYGTGNFFGSKVQMDYTGAFSAGPQMAVVTDPTSSLTSPVYLALRTNADSVVGGRTPVDTDPLIKVVKLQPRSGGGALTAQNTGYVSTTQDLTLRTVADRGSRPIITLDNSRRSLDVFYAAPENPAGLQPSNVTGVIYHQGIAIDSGFTKSDPVIALADSATSSGTTANKPDGMSLPTSTQQILGGASGTVVQATDTVVANLNAPSLSITRKFWHNDLFRATSANFVAEIPVAADNTAGLRVNFTDTSLGRPTSWAWDFGDGATSTEQNPTHTYASGGAKTVSLTVNNVNGSQTTKTKTVTVGEAPAAAFTASLPNKQRLLVQVKDASTGGAADSLRWNFGDGTSVVTSGLPGTIARHAYAKSGKYKITLVATNGVGSSIKTLTVVVNATPGKIAKPTRTVLAGKKVTVAWKAPKPNGLPITKYWVTCRSSVNTRSIVIKAKDGTTTVGKARKATVVKLTAGASYTCTVKAYNTRGWNLPSLPSTAFKARA